MGTLNETCYDHVKGEDFFTMTAAEVWSIAMVHRLKEKHPAAVEIRHTNPDGSMVVRMPFSWMRVVPKRELSAEHIAKITQNFSRPNSTEETEPICAGSTPAHAGIYPNI